MELRDLVVTPFIVFCIYTIAYFIRNRVTDSTNRKYFFPALTARLFGALALGFIYQFYYNGGDTYNFHTRGSRHIWNAFVEDPTLGIELLLGNDKAFGAYKYVSQIVFFHDSSSFAVIQIAAFFDLFTFSAYAGTAMFFAVISFIGAWMLFLTFYKAYPHLHKSIAIATLFIPSVVFWGSGLLKDTITLACAGASTFIIRDIFSKGRLTISNTLLLLFCFWIIYSIKKYILLCFFPAAFIWFYLGYLARFRSVVFKVIMVPFVFLASAACGYLAIRQVGKDDTRYSINELGKTAQVTAYDILYQTGKDAGSSYDLGDQDGTLTGLVKMAPRAVNVSLYRPYLWEVRNPLMLLSALESLSLLIVTIYLMISGTRYIRKGIVNPDVLFCLIFSVTFAFAVGVSTYNFGTLSRYKIPLLPYFTLALILLNHYVKLNRSEDFWNATQRDLERYQNEPL
jgi:hypothetical protein